MVEAQNVHREKQMKQVRTGKQTISGSCGGRRAIS